jgi:hypothetical protein
VATPVTVFPVSLASQRIPRGLPSAEPTPSVPSQTPAALADGGSEGEGAVLPWPQAAIVMANTSMNGGVMDVRIVLCLPVSSRPAGSIPRDRQESAFYVVRHGRKVALILTMMALVVIIVANGRRSTAPPRK